MAVHGQSSLLLDCLIDYAVVFLDVDGRVTRWNTGAEQIFGYTQTDILGHSFARLFTPDGYSSLAQLHLDLADTHAHPPEVTPALRTAQLVPFMNVSFNVFTGRAINGTAVFRDYGAVVSLLRRQVKTDR